MKAKVKEMVTVEQLANMIDHTNLKAFADDAAFEKLCDEAKKYNFKMVAINPAQTVRCKKKLEGSPVHVGAAIGFPLGQTTLECKIFETKDAIEKGADEIDYVINVAELKNKNYDYIKKEMEEIVKICREAGKTSKVIFENCYLTDDEKRKVAEIAKEVKPDFIKTSTGFGTGGATVEDVKLMKSVVGDEVKVKAAGGIRDLKTALAMIEAGAERLGTSAGVAIVEEYNNRPHSTLCKIFKSKDITPTMVHEDMQMELFVMNHILNNPEKLKEVLEHFGYCNIVIRPTYMQFIQKKKAK